MFEVFNTKTNRVMRKCRDAREAHRATAEYEEAFKWVDGSKFDYRSMSDAESQEWRRREQRRKIRRNGGGLKQQRMRLNFR